MLRPSCRSGSSLVACSFWGRKNVFTQPGSKAALTAPKSNFRITPESGLKSDIARCPFRATNGSRVLFDQLVGLSEQRGRHGEAGGGAAQSRSPLRAVLIHPIVSAVLAR